MRISDWSSDVCSSDLTAYSVDADVPPADVSNNEGSMFKPGEAWQSPDRSRSIRVEAMTETGFTVTIGPQLRITGGRLPGLRKAADQLAPQRSEEHTSELQSLMRISYAVFCLKKKNT